MIQVSVGELVFLYFQGDYRKMVRFLKELEGLTNMDTKGYIRTLDKLMCEKN